MPLLIFQLSTVASLRKWRTPSCKVPRSCRTCTGARPTIAVSRGSWWDHGRSGAPRTGPGALLPRAKVRPRSSDVPAVVVSISEKLFIVHTGECKSGICLCLRCDVSPSKSARRLLERSLEGVLQAPRHHHHRVQAGLHLHRAERRHLREWRPLVAQPPAVRPYRWTNATAAKRLASLTPTDLRTLLFQHGPAAWGTDPRAHIFTNTRQGSEQPIKVETCDSALFSFV